MKQFFFALLLTSSCFAEMNLFQPAEPKISVQNKILAKVNGNTISVIDVMKKLDLLLHQNYPQFADSPQARFQFYSSSWRPVFMEMVDTELMLSDAAEREIKLTDGEVREELQDRFGPNVLLTLDQIGLSYDDAWKLIRNDLIVRRMMWFFVQSKAIQSVGPQAIRQAYRQYLAEHPPYRELKYRVIAVQSSENAALYAEEIHQLLTTTPEPESAVKEWEQSHPHCTVQFSNEYLAKDTELSDSHKTALAFLSPGSYSQPIAQQSRFDRKTIHRIFYLAEETRNPAPAFEELANQLKNALIQKAMAQESETYLAKLRNHYGFDPNYLKETVPSDLKPFALE